MFTKKQKASLEEKLISACRLMYFKNTVSSKKAVILSLNKIRETESQ
jgi:hypothetical protein